MEVKIRESVEAVRELPKQIKFTINLAISALIVAFIAMALSVVTATKGRS